MTKLHKVWVIYQLTKSDNWGWGWILCNSKTEADRELDRTQKQYPDTTFIIRPIQETEV